MAKSLDANKGLWKKDLNRSLQKHNYHYLPEYKNKATVKP